MKATNWLLLGSRAKCLTNTARLTERKRRKTQLKSETKVGTLLLTLRKEKGCKRTLGTIIPQPIREPRANGKIPGNMPTTKKDSEEIGNLNRPITIERLCQNQKPPRENPGPAGVTAECSRTFREELTPSFSNSFPRLKKQEHFLIYSIRPAFPWYRSQINTSQE